MIVSSHVLEEVERLGSQVLVMSQGRLAAAGDFHELRALMDDRPMRIRVRTDRPRELAGALLEAGTAVGVRLDGDDVLELDTRDARALARALAPVARDRDARLLRGASARRRPRGRLPLRGAAMSTARNGGPDSPGHARLARRALPAAAAHADHRSPPARHRRARRALDPDRAVRPLGRRPVAGGRGRGLRLRARDPRAARDALARHFGDRRPRGGQAARLPVAEAGAALAASRGGHPRDGQHRRAADRAAAHRVRSRRGSAATWPGRRCSPRRSPRSPTRASSSQRASGSGARSGGGLPSS